MSAAKNNTTPAFNGLPNDGSLPNAEPDFNLEGETEASRDALIALNGKVSFGTCLGIFFPAVTGIMGERASQ